MIILIMGCIGVFLFGCLLYRAGYEESGILISALTFAFFVGVLFYGTFENHSYTYEDIIPNAIVRTSDGYTIATIKDRAIVSDKGSIYLSSETNVFIRVTTDLNAWGWKADTLYELVIK